MKASPGPWAWLGLWDVAPGWLVDRDNGYVLICSEPAELECSDANRTLIRLAPDMASLLRELEWAGHDCVALCPVCGQRPERTRSVPGDAVPGRPGFVFETRKTETVPGGHAPDCRLAKLLSELPE